MTEDLKVPSRVADAVIAELTSQRDAAFARCMQFAVELNTARTRIAELETAAKKALDEG